MLELFVKNDCGMGWEMDNFINLSFDQVSYLWKFQGWNVTKRKKIINIFNTKNMLKRRHNVSICKPCIGYSVDINNWNILQMMVSIRYMACKFKRFVVVFKCLISILHLWKFDNFLIFIINYRGNLYHVCVMITEWFSLIVGVKERRLR